MQMIDLFIANDAKGIEFIVVDRLVKLLAVNLVAVNLIIG